ncbi:hypothetical protein [Citrobacter braakii]|uniref:hypothetical protein n=1 Tax=Citrobacter braakii TaxID=57706 RepID=UPI0039B679BE
MKKRYIISLNPATPEQDKKFVAFIKEHGLGWWHWLENTWLLVDRNGRFSAAELRAELKNIYPKIHMLVIELSDEGDNWAGFGPKSEDQDMFSWIKRNWETKNTSK